MESLPLAAIGEHLVVLAVVLGLVAALLGAIAGLGRWAAATHPDPAPKAGAGAVVQAAPAVTALEAASHADVPAEVLAAIAASVAAVFGPGARIAGIEPARQDPATKVSVEALYLQWSVEGRRQIYSSHRFR